MSTLLHTSSQENATQRSVYGYDFRAVDRAVKSLTNQHSSSQLSLAYCAYLPYSSIVTVGVMIGSRLNAYKALFPTRYMKKNKGRTSKRLSASATKTLCNKECNSKHMHQEAFPSLIPCKCLTLAQTLGLTRTGSFLPFNFWSINHKPTTNCSRLRSSGSSGATRS